MLWQALVDCVNHIALCYIKWHIVMWLIQHGMTHHNAKYHLEYVEKQQKTWSHFDCLIFWLEEKSPSSGQWPGKGSGHAGGFQVLCGSFLCNVQVMEQTFTFLGGLINAEFELSVLKPFCYSLVTISFPHVKIAFITYIKRISPAHSS